MKRSDPSFKKNRAAWLRDIERSNVGRLRAELKTLVGKCKVARLRRRTAIVSAKEECAEHVTTTRAAFNKVLSKCGSRRACAPARSARYAATTSARSACANMKADARAPYDARLESLYAKRESVAEDIRNRSRSRNAKSSTRLSALEKRSEDNESVERDIAAIDPMLVGIWRKHSRQFKKSEHASRYEKFLLWVEENPHIVEDEQSRLGASRDAGNDCEEAVFLGKKGNVSARKWAEENCGKGRR